MAYHGAEIQNALHVLQICDRWETLEFLVVHFSNIII